jgi:Rne/Rng family ribonuclease
MSLDILIEELEGSLWVATLKNGLLQGLEIDPFLEQVRWGSIYWAKVKSIDSSLDAAYLDLDGKNIGLLFNKDARILGPDGRYTKGGGKAIGTVLKGGDMVIVQSKTSYTPRNDEDDLPLENKYPRMSMDITLPGRYLIYCPRIHDNQISRRIREKPLRRTILTMMETMVDIQGCILRAAAANTQTEILMREGKILKKAWEEMQKRFKGSKPVLVMVGPDSLQRSLSDHAASHIENIEVAIMDHYTQAEDWCSIFAPDLMTKIHPVELKNATDDFALFDYRDILGQIEDLLQPYALLNGGGNIIVQETTALCAIDVNRGGDKASNLAINIEAAEEIARHIRIRNIGGIIMVDFLKMQGKPMKDKLLTALENAIQQDPCTVQIHGMTALGIVEISRKRRTSPLAERIDENMF